ncbi:hypothetical protein GCM10022205_21710 [Spinactinospora alkalitolerans]
MVELVGRAQQQRLGDRETDLTRDRTASPHVGDGVHQFIPGLQELREPWVFPFHSTASDTWPTLAPATIGSIDIK